MLNKLKKWLNKLLFTLPSRLPVGMIEFKDWADSIVSTYNLPDNDSIRFALATMILHLESNSKIEVNLLVLKLIIPTSSWKSKRHFAEMTLKSMSNQISSAVMHDLKDKQKKLEEESAAKASENDKA